MTEKSRKMVRTDIEWIKLNIKQCVLNLSFWCMLSAAVMFMYLLSCISAQNEQSVNVLMVCEDGESGREIADDLIREAPAGYDFSYADSVDEMMQLVTTGEADCGVIFESDVDRRLSDGKLKDAVTFYQYAGSAAGYTAREVIFPHLLKRASNGLIEDYIMKQDPSTTDEVKGVIRTANDAFVSGTDINIFTLKEIEGPEGDSDVRLPLKGYLVLAVSIFIAVVMVIESENGNRNYYRSLKGNIRVRRRVEAAAVRIVLISIILLIAAAVI